MWSQVSSHPYRPVEEKIPLCVGPIFPPPFMRLVRISLFSISCIKINPKQLSELRGTDFPEGKPFKGMSELNRGIE